MGTSKRRLQDDRSGTHNVRLQARAARGAPSCKPLFGGKQAKTGFLRTIANGHESSFADYHAFCD